jgi:hypothetical protein
LIIPRSGHDESKKLAETVEGFERDFEKLLTQVEVDTVIVSIDDLDRCSNDKVAETFERTEFLTNTLPHPNHHGHCRKDATSASDRSPVQLVVVASSMARLNRSKRPFICLARFASSRAASVSLEALSRFARTTPSMLFMA